MKLLIVAPRLPYPLDKGDRLTVFNLLKYLGARHQVALICFVEAGQRPEWAQHLAPFCVRIETVPLRKPYAYFRCLMGLPGATPLQVLYYDTPIMRRAVQQSVSRFRPDLLYAHTIRMGRYILPYPRLPRVLAMQVSMTLNYRRLMDHADWPQKTLYSLEYHKLRTFEASFAKSFERVLLISPYDLAAIEQGHTLHNVFFSPHGVDYDYFAPDTSAVKESDSIIFTGNMQYAPNADAVLYFYNEIFPHVRQRIPKVKWYVVGTDPTPEVKAIQQDPAVIVTGRVPDLRVYMNRAQVAIDPLRVGAGLQNKVLEGMAMELPMVITPVANEGIQAIGGENILIADSPQLFAEHTIDLLCDPAKRLQIGQRARDFITRNWSWEKHFADLEQMLISLENTNQRSGICAERPEGTKGKD
jgi:sugar transferase (PEP-CTERM/EpsH1 system associated)